MVNFRQHNFQDAVNRCNQDIRRHLVVVDAAIRTDLPDTALDVLQQLDPGDESEFQAADYEMLGRLYERLGRSCEGLAYLSFRTDCFARAEKLYDSAGKPDRSLWVFTNLKFTAHNRISRYLRRN